MITDTTDSHSLQSSLELVTPPNMQLRRRRSHEISGTNVIDLSSARRISPIGENIFELVDITERDEEEELDRTLYCSETNEQFVSGPPRLLYDVFGEVYTYNPRFHVSPNFN